MYGYGALRDMALMKTSNPALGENTFRGFGGGGQYGYGPIDVASRMTLSGTVSQYFRAAADLRLRYGCARDPGTASWLPAVSTMSQVLMLLIGLFGGFIMASGHRLQEGVVAGDRASLCAAGGHGAGRNLGYLRPALPRHRRPGRGAHAFGTLLALAVCLQPGAADQGHAKFQLGVVAATGGIMLFYFLQMVLGFFHVPFLSSVYGSGPGAGIVFSVIVVAVAALNLILDFNFIEQGVNYGAPKYMEWYGAFGIMVTLVWLYLEILRLLAKMRDRNS